MIEGNCLHEQEDLEKSLDTATVIQSPGMFILAEDDTFASHNKGECASSSVRKLGRCVYSSGSGIVQTSSEKQRSIEEVDMERYVIVLICLDLQYWLRFSLSFQMGTCHWRTCIVCFTCKPANALACNTSKDKLENTNCNSAQSFGS